jgi:hypothetical protein
LEPTRGILQFNCLSSTVPQAGSDIYLGWTTFALPEQTDGALTLEYNYNQNPIALLSPRDISLNESRYRVEQLQTQTTFTLTAHDGRGAIINQAHVEVTPHSTVVQCTNLTKSSGVPLVVHAGLTLSCDTIRAESVTLHVDDGAEGSAALNIDRNGHVSCDVLCFDGQSFTVLQQNEVKGTIALTPALLAGSAITFRVTAKGHDGTEIDGTARVDLGPAVIDGLNLYRGQGNWISAEWETSGAATGTLVVAKTAVIDQAVYPGAGNSIAHLYLDQPTLSHHPLVTVTAQGFGKAVTLTKKFGQP